MNQDTRAQLHSITNTAIDNAISKLFFFHQNIDLIKHNQQQLVELIKTTNLILKQTHESNIHVVPYKLQTIQSLTEFFILIIQPEQEHNQQLIH